MVRIHTAWKTTEFQSSSSHQHPVLFLLCNMPASLSKSALLFSCHWLENSPHSYRNSSTGCWFDCFSLLLSILLGRALCTWLLYLSSHSWYSHGLLYATTSCISLPEQKAVSRVLDTAWLTGLVQRTLLWRVTAALVTIHLWEIQLNRRETGPVFCVHGIGSCPCQCFPTHGPWTRASDSS